MGAGREALSVRQPFSVRAVYVPRCWGAPPGPWKNGPNANCGWQTPPVGVCRGPGHVLQHSGKVSNHAVRSSCHTALPSSRNTEKSPLLHTLPHACYFCDVTQCLGQNPRAWPVIQPALVPNVRDLGPTPHTDHTAYESRGGSGLSVT